MVHKHDRFGADSGWLSPTRIALSIFGDHSDVMAVRSTGCALLCSASVQEAQDLAAITTRSTLGSRIPFLHFFDGFRTSHEIQKVALLEDETLQELIPSNWIVAHRSRALTPDSENRFKMLTRSNPDQAKRLAKLAQSDADPRWQLYQALAARHVDASQPHPQQQQ